ncbi:MAG: RloB family protein [Candidatus Zixiibacteriota bacterium]
MPGKWRYKPKPARRTSEKIYIFPEGDKKEIRYFEYFQDKIEKQHKIEIVPIPHGERNHSPLGLFDFAKAAFFDENCTEYTNFRANNYELLSKDQVWIIFDTDPQTWENEAIEYLYFMVSNKPNWFVAESNPCFEVWLYYHFFEKNAYEEYHDEEIDWKTFLGEKIKGGFNPNKDPEGLKNAIEYSQKAFKYLRTESEILNKEAFVNYMVEKELNLTKEKNWEKDFKYDCDFSEILKDRPDNGHTNLFKLGAIIINLLE